MPEKFEQSPLDKFRAEVAELKRREEKTGTTSHFDSLDADQLTQKDMEIFNKFKAGSLELDELRAYKDTLAFPPDGVHNESSKQLAGYLSNMMTARILEEEMERIKGDNIE